VTRKRNAARDRRGSFRRPKGFTLEETAAPWRLGDASGGQRAAPFGNPRGFAASALAGLETAAQLPDSRPMFYRCLTTSASHDGIPKGCALWPPEASSPDQLCSGLGLRRTRASREGCSGLNGCRTTPALVRVLMPQTWKRERPWPVSRAPAMASRASRTGIVSA